MPATASDLADYLASRMPICGSISTAQAARELYRRYGFLGRGMVEHAIIIASGRGQITRDHGGATLRRGK